VIRRTWEKIQQNSDYFVLILAQTINTSGPEFSGKEKKNGSR
jgi:hypothetical protein